MTKRIEKAVTDSLYNARLHLASRVDKQVGDLDACVTLFHAEAAVKLENLNPTARQYMIDWINS